MFAQRLVQFGPKHFLLPGRGAVAPAQSQRDGATTEEEPRQNALTRKIHWLVETITDNAASVVLAPSAQQSQTQTVMPSFDIVSEVDVHEIDNALNQARKELATRFDFKGTTAEILSEKDKITLTAEDASRLRGLREIVIGKLGKRGVDLRNVEQVDPAISPLGHARQELKIQQGLEGDKAKEIIHAIKGQNFKVQSQLQERQIRVTGKKRDDLQAVIAFVRSRDFGVATNFKNFRD
jgi:uncharacterized protein YajQ (UPF0234 family)